MGICGSTLNSRSKKIANVRMFSNDRRQGRDSYSVRAVSPSSTAIVSKASVADIPTFEAPDFISHSALIEEAFRKLPQPILLINFAATDFLWMNNTARRVIGELSLDKVFSRCVKKHSSSYFEFFERSSAVLETSLKEEMKESLLLQADVGGQVVEIHTWIRVIKLSEGFLVELLGKEPLVELLELAVKEQKAIWHEERNVQSAFEHHLRGSSDAISQAMKLLAGPASPRSAGILACLDEAQKEHDLAMSCEQYTALMGNFLLSAEHKEDFKLRESISPIVDMLAAEKCIEFVKEGILASEDEYVLHGQKSLLLYALVNLIQNAIKFTKHKSLSASSSSSSLSSDLKITVSVIEENDKFWFSVTDTGIGMTPEHQLRCLSGATNRFNTSVQGSGSGLSSIVGKFKKADGLIEVSSVLGKGTSFKFTLPLIVKQKYSSVEVFNKKQLEEVKPDYSSVCVLAVDDNLTNRKMLKRFLLDAGLSLENIFLAESMSEGCKVFQQQSLKRAIDLVFTDFHLGTVQNGLDLAHFIREYEKENPQMKPVHIVLLSGAPCKDEPNFYLINKDHIKPIRREQILAALKEAKNNAAQWILTQTSLVDPEDIEQEQFRLPSL